MKFLISLLIFFPTITFAEQWYRKPIFCDTTQAIHNRLDEFGEKPLLGGATLLPEIGTGKIINKASFIMYANIEKKTFSFIEYLSPEAACFIMIGNSLNFDAQEIEKRRDAWINKSNGDGT